MISFQNASSLKEIGERCFSGTRVEEVVIPRSVVTIGVGAFYDCWALRRVTFQERGSLQKLCDRCFSKTGLLEIEIPSTVTVIEQSAF